MPCMVGAVVARAGVREDREVSSMHRHPRREGADLAGRDRQLAAAARMRTDRLQMKVADRQIEPALRHLREFPGSLDLVWIEVDVGVKIGNLNHAREVGPGAATC